MSRGDDGEMDDVLNRGNKSFRTRVLIITVHTRASGIAHYNIVRIPNNNNSNK